MESLQLTLFEDREPDDDPAEPPASAHQIVAGLHERLAARLTGSRLGELTLTDNRSTILSSRTSARAGTRGRLDVRLHWSFVDAPAPVLAAVARIVDGPHRGEPLRRARVAIREWVAEHAGDEAPAQLSGVVRGGRRRARPPVAPEPGAHVHDLEAIRDEVNRRYFGGRHEVAIGWSRVGHSARRRRSRRRTIKLGSFSHDDRTVRIHPALDHSSVPGWVVASVVHHELLHADIDPVVKNGLRRLHTPEFRRREREFERHDDARRWIDRHLGALLRRRARLAPG